VALPLNMDDDDKILLRCCMENQT